MIQKIIWLCTRHESRQKNMDPSIFLANFWNLFLKSENLKLLCAINLKKSGKFVSFFPLKILCTDPNHIFQVKIWKNFTQNKHWVGGCMGVEIKVHDFAKTVSMKLALTKMSSTTFKGFKSYKACYICH